LSGNPVAVDPTPPGRCGQTGRVQVTISAPGFRMRCTGTVPTGSIVEHETVPVLGHLADAITDAAGNGREVTCRVGCGACCRQLVPVSVPELRHLAGVLAEHPQSDRIALRYDALQDKLRATGLYDPVREVAGLSRDAVARLAREYFRLDVSCPFLEEGQCLIYSDRPLACREYLVTSAAVECGRPDFGNVNRVELPVSLAARVAANASQPGKHSMAFVPDPATFEHFNRRPAVDWLRRLLGSSTVQV
jgi:Fe-S-cluster containining protein